MVIKVNISEVRGMKYRGWYREWRMRRALEAFTRQWLADRSQQLNTPWAMLDREEAVRAGQDWCRRLGIDLASVQQIRPILGPGNF